MINTFIQPREKITSDSIPSNYIKSKRNKSKTSINEKESNSYLSSNNIFFSSTYQNVPKTITTLFEIESLSENLTILISFFFSNYHDRNKIEKFKKKYINYFTGGYLDIIFTMREFPEFSILDYINLNIDLNIHELSEQKIREQKLMLITRNNIILNLLIIATDIHFREFEGEINFSKAFSENENKQPNYNDNELLFEDLSFLTSTIEQFKALVVENENIFNIEYDVEILFLALLGYKDKAKIIKQKHNDYFKNFLSDCDIIDEFNFDDFLTVTVEKKSFSSLTTNEILVFRKILNNTARRKFYLGFEFIMRNVEFCYLVSEGRIWKNIGKKMTEEQVYNLWGIYEENIEEIKHADLKETIGHEYKNKINSLNGERKLYQFFKDNNKGKVPTINSNSEDYDKEANYNIIMGRLKHNIDKLMNEIHLYFVTSLKELIHIFFKCDLKELVMYFFDQYKIDRNDPFIPLDIFEISLEYDEDITIDILDRALNNINVKVSYMRICLVKKYFKLARLLLKFKNCKEFLNSPPPETDEYIGIISKLEVGSKSKQIDEITYKHPKEESKIIDFLRKHSIESNEDYTSDEGTLGNNNEEDSVVSKSTNTKVDNALKNIKNSTFNKNKKAIITEKEEDSIIKNPNKFRNSNIIKKKLHNSNIITQSEKLKNNDFKKIIKRGSASYNFPVYNDSSEMNFLDYQKDSLTSLLFQKNDKNKDSILSKLKSNINNIIGVDKDKEPYLQVISLNSNQKKRSSIILPNFSKGSVGTPKSEVSLKGNRKRRKSFFIPSLFESITPSGNLSNISSVNKSKNDIIIVDKTEIEDNESEYSSKEKKNNKILSSPEIKHFQIEQNITSKKKKSLNKKKKLLEKDIIHYFKKGKLKINVQLVLIDELRNGEYACDALCLLSCIEDKCLNINYFQKIFSYLLVFTSHEEAITKCKEPLLFIALAAEFLLKIGNLNKKILYKAQAVANEILDLGEKLQSSIQDEDMLNYFLKEQFDHRKRNTIEIYAENKFFNLLSNANVGGIVSKLWYGSGHEFSIFHYLRITRLLTTQVMYENYDFVVSKTYYPPNCMFSFQFNCYKKNCSSRYYFNSITMFLITIYYEYIAYILPKNIGKNHKFLLKHEKIANALLFSYFLNFIFTYIYVYKTGRTITIMKLEIVIICIIGCGVFLLYINFPDLIYPIGKSQLITKDHEFVEAIIVSIILIMSWLKVFCILMETLMYGLFIRILMKVFWHVFAFMIINLCITFLFSQIFTIFFRFSNFNFDFFYNSFLFLFGTAFGQVEFDDFTHLSVFGYVCLMLFTTLSNIILFNLIVGMMNNLFENSVEDADAESRAMLVLTHERLRWDDKFGLLILLPSPLNFFSFFCNIFLLFYNEQYGNAEKINDILSKIFYIFIAIIYFFFSAFIGIICYPFSLIKGFYHIIFDYICKKTYNENGKLEKNHFIYQLLYDLLTLPFKLIYFHIEDLFLFWKLCYQEKIKSDEIKENTFFSKEYIIELRKILTQLRFKEKKKVVTLYEMYERFHLFNRKKNIKGLFSSKNSVDDISLNTNDDISPNYTVNGDIYSEDEHLKKGGKKNLFSQSNRNLDNKIIKESIKYKFKVLLDKLVDTEGFIDLERALIILPYKVKYTNSFFQCLKYLNTKVLIRGMRKFLFKIEGDNSKYAFKKMQLLIYKIMLKFNMLYYYLSDESILKINEITKLVESHPQYGKNGILLQMLEKRDDGSEYEDEDNGLTNFFDYNAKKKSTTAFNSRYSGNLSTASYITNSGGSK